MWRCCPAGGIPGACRRDSTVACGCTCVLRRHAFLRSGGPAVGRCLCPAARRSTGGPVLKLAIVVPGGMDRSGEYRVIPVFLALIARLAGHHDVHVFVLHQEPLPATWPLLGATVHN